MRLVEFRECSRHENPDFAQCLVDRPGGRVHEHSSSSLRVCPARSEGRCRRLPHDLIDCSPERLDLCPAGMVDVRSLRLRERSKFVIRYYNLSFIMTLFGSSHYSFSWCISYQRIVAPRLWTQERVAARGRPRLHVMLSRLTSKMRVARAGTGPAPRSP